jgi:hypothetical protein
MEKVENPTAIRVKNSFSIENILSRPDNCENQRRMVRQNPLENNHVLFYGNSMNQSLSGSDPSSLVKSEENCKHTDTIDNDDNDSEAASDDGNSSVHSE